MPKRQAAGRALHGACVWRFLGGRLSPSWQPNTGNISCVAKSIRNLADENDGSIGLAASISGIADRSKRDLCRQGEARSRPALHTARRAEGRV